MQPFEEPASSGDRFSAEEAMHRRLIVVPIEHIPAIPTSRGEPTDGIKINVVDLQAEGGPKAYMGAIWFGGRLIRAFKNSTGKMFCGYVGKERTNAGYPAWTFYSLTQDPGTVQAATAYLNQHPEFMQACQNDVAALAGFQQPAAAPPDPWAGAQPQAPVPAPPAPPVPPPAPAAWVSSTVTSTAPPAPPVAPPVPPVPPAQPTAPVTPPVPAAPPVPPTVPSAPPAAAAAQTVMERLRAAREQVPEPNEGQFPF